MGQEGFTSGKEKIGDNIGKSRDIIFRSRRCICLDPFSFSFILPFSILYFRARRPGEKNNRHHSQQQGKTARVQGGMDSGTSNQGIFFFLDGDRFLVSWFRLE